MSEETKVTIDGEEYSFEGLAVETQANIARVNELRREVSLLPKHTQHKELKNDT